MGNAHSTGSQAGGGTPEHGTKAGKGGKAEHASPKQEQQHHHHSQQKQPQGLPKLQTARDQLQTAAQPAAKSKDEVHLGSPQPGQFLSPHTNKKLEGNFPERLDERPTNTNAVTARLRALTGSSIDSSVNSPGASPVMGHSANSPSLEFVSSGDDLRKMEESERSSSTQELPALPVDMPSVKRGSVGSAMEEMGELDFEAETGKNVSPTFIAWSGPAEKVYITGTFTGWRRKIPLTKTKNDFSALLPLPIGTHRFKFLVDNEWRCSDELAQATDSAGILVNYLEVPTSVENLPTLERSEKHGDLSEMTQRPQEVWTRRIPSFIVDAVERSSSHPSPPSLPPHLEKVILNANNTMKDDSSVLPNPNHVVLNHLSASSIKNNVLAVSATTRYRRKYVSTILYKALDLN